MHRLKLAVLGSTKGTDMQAIIDAIERNELNAEISLVVSNEKDAYILERAQQHGLETLVVDYKQYKKEGTCALHTRLAEKRSGYLNPSYETGVRADDMTTRWK